MGNHGQPFPPRNCLHCGRQFRPYTRAQDCCSAQCRDRRRQTERSAAIHAAWKPRTCERCGREFPPTVRRDQRFCGQPDCIPPPESNADITLASLALANLPQPRAQIPPPLRALWKAVPLHAAQSPLRALLPADCGWRACAAAPAAGIPADLPGVPETVFRAAAQRPFLFAGLSAGRARCAEVPQAAAEEAGGPGNPPLHDLRRPLRRLPQEPRLLPAAGVPRDIQGPPGAGPAAAAGSGRGKESPRRARVDRDTYRCEICGRSLADLPDLKIYRYTCSPECRHEAMRRKQRRNYVARRNRQNLAVGPAARSPRRICWAACRASWQKRRMTCGRWPRSWPSWSGEARTSPACGWGSSITSAGSPPGSCCRRSWSISPATRRC